MKSRIPLFILTTCFALTTIGCTSRPNPAKDKDNANKGGKAKVAFVSNNAYDFWTFAQRGAEKAAKEFDVELEFKKPSKNTAQVQREILEDLINRGFNGVAVSP